MLRLVRVSGDSLTPEYQDGDFVLTLKIPIQLAWPRPGDTLVFRHPVYGTLIKKVERSEPPQRHIFVTGVHPHSVDSRRFGPIGPQDVIGKVIWHIRRPRD